MASPTISPALPAATLSRPNGRKRKPAATRMARATAMPENHAFTRQLNATLRALAEGDFSARLSSHWPGQESRVAENVNAIASRLERFNVNLLRLQHQVGEEGKINVRMPLGDSVGK